MGVIKLDQNQRGTAQIIALVILFVIVVISLSIGLFISITKNLNRNKGLAMARQQGYTMVPRIKKIRTTKPPKPPLNSPIVSIRLLKLQAVLRFIFLKNWSAYVNESSDSGSVLTLLVNPDFVIASTQSSGGNYALSVKLLNTQYADSIASLNNSDAKSTSIIKDVTVSHIKGVWVSGQLDSTHHGIEVLLPIRDKTLAIETDGTNYQSDFQQILTQAKIFP